MVANGAEPVSVPTLRRFTERFARYGFRPEAMAPVYGLAENAVGLAFPPPGRPPVIDRVDREALSRRGVAEPARAGRPASARDRRLRPAAARSRNPHRRRGRLRSRRAARGPARVPRSLGDLRLFPQRDEDPRADPRRLARQRRPRLYGRRRRLRHRPDQGHHHPRRPAHLSAGNRGGRRRDPGHPQGLRGRLRRRGRSLRHRAGGRSGRDARDRSRCPRSAAGARAGGRGRYRRHAARRDRARPAAERAEDLERQAPPQRRQGTLCQRAHRCAAARGVAADPAPVARRNRSAGPPARRDSRRDALCRLVVDRAGA